MEHQAQNDTVPRMESLGAYETPQGTMKTIHIGRQENLNVDEYRPAIVVPGWGITLNSEMSFLYDMVDSGKDVISMEFPRRGGSVDSIDEFAEETTRKAEMVSQFLDSLPDGKYDLVGQSEAAMVILSALALNPKLIDKIKNIVFNSSAGLGENDNLPWLMVRYLSHLNQDTAHLFKSPIKHRNIIKMGLEAGKFVGKNPARALKEAHAISQGGLYKYLQPLKERGIRIGLIQGEDDKLTPAKKLWEKIGEGTQSQFAIDENTQSGYRYVEKENPVPPFDSITMVKGGHDNRIYAEPGYVAKVIKTIKSLDDSAWINHGLKNS